MAFSVVEETSSTLGAGFASVISLVSPEVDVIVGGVAASAGQLLEPVRRHVTARTFTVAASSCRIKQGALGKATGVIGAAGVFLASRKKATASASSPSR